MEKQRTTVPFLLFILVCELFDLELASFWQNSWQYSFPGVLIKQQKFDLLISEALGFFFSLRLVNKVKLTENCAVMYQ